MSDLGAFMAGTDEVNGTQSLAELREFLREREILAQGKFYTKVLTSREAQVPPFRGFPFSFF